MITFINKIKIFVVNFLLCVSLSGYAQQIDENLFSQQDAEEELEESQKSGNENSSENADQELTLENMMDSIWPQSEELKNLVGDEHSNLFRRFDLSMTNLRIAHDSYQEALSNNQDTSYEVSALRSRLTSLYSSVKRLKRGLVTNGVFNAKVEDLYNKLSDSINNSLELASNL